MFEHETIIGFLVVIVIIIILTITIRVYNVCKALTIRLDELAAEIHSSKTKLNRVYSEIGVLLNKYSIHESSILNSVAAGQANIQVLASKYPQLKSDSLYQSASAKFDILYSELQTNISSYNKQITTYNTYVTNFPRSLISKTLGFAPKNHAKII